MVSACLPARHFHLTASKSADLKMIFSPLQLPRMALIYLGGTGGLFSHKKGSNQPAVRINGIPADRISALALTDQNLLVGTEKNGLFVLDIRNAMARKITYDANSLGNSVNSIAVDQQADFTWVPKMVFTCLTRTFMKPAILHTMRGIAP